MALKVLDQRGGAEDLLGGLLASQARVASLAENGTAGASFFSGS